MERLERVLFPGLNHVVAGLVVITSTISQTIVALRLVKDNLLGKGEDNSLVAQGLEVTQRLANLSLVGTGAELVVNHPSNQAVQDWVSIRVEERGLGVRDETHGGD